MYTLLIPTEINKLAKKENIYNTIRSFWTLFNHIVVLLLDFLKVDDIILMSWRYIQKYLEIK